MRYLERARRRTGSLQIQAKVGSAISVYTDLLKITSILRGCYLTSKRQSKSLELSRNLSPPSDTGRGIRFSTDADIIMERCGLEGV